MLLNIIYTIIWGAIFIVLAPVHVLLSAVVLVVTLPFDKQRRSQCYYSRFIMRCIIFTSPFMRITIKGLENVDKNKTYIVVSNHQSMLDILFMYYVPLCFKWVSKIETYRIPLVGLLLWMHNDVTIRRGDAFSTRQMLRECSIWLKAGMSVVMFPEGTRSKTGKVDVFKEGAFLLAKRNRIPILPVIVDGTRAFSNSNKYHILNARQKIQLTILPPVSVEEMEDISIRDLTSSVRDKIVEEYNKMTCK
jgi:1-acyl-sn-glycerol-3-phosphate acyltransferase